MNLNIQIRGPKEIHYEGIWTPSRNGFRTNDSRRVFLCFIYVKEPENALKPDMLFSPKLYVIAKAPLWFSDTLISKEVSWPLCVLTTDTQSERSPFGFQAEFLQGLNGVAVSRHRWQWRRNYNKDAAAQFAKQKRHSDRVEVPRWQNMCLTSFWKSRYWTLKKNKNE